MMRSTSRAYARVFLIRLSVIFCIGVSIIIALVFFLMSSYTTTTEVYGHLFTSKKSMTEARGVVYAPRNSLAFYEPGSAVEISIFHTTPSKTNCLVYEIDKQKNTIYCTINKIELPLELIITIENTETAALHARLKTGRSSMIKSITASLNKKLRLD